MNNNFNELQSYVNKLNINAYYLEFTTMSLSALEIAVIGFGVVGATVAGNAAHRAATRAGCTPNEALATSCVVAGLSAAVLPAAAVAGVCVTASTAYGAFKNREDLVTRARIQMLQAKGEVLGAASKIGDAPKARASR